MDKSALIRLCKELGCCDVCCLRYLGLKNPSAYENPQQYLLQYEVQPESKSSPPEAPTEGFPVIKDNAGPTTIIEDGMTPATVMEVDAAPTIVMEDNGNVAPKPAMEDNGAPIAAIANNEAPTAVMEDVVAPRAGMKNNSTLASVMKDGVTPVAVMEDDVTPTDNPQVCSASPPHKRQRKDVCTSCLGLLQEAGWDECCDMLKETLDKKGYEGSSFACALSAPVATLPRERALGMRLKEALPGYDPGTLTSLKEAWKWSLGPRLAQRAGRELQSGAVSALLATFHMEYPDEMQELKALMALCPASFNARGRRATPELTRRAVTQALASLQALPLPRRAARPARAARVTAEHSPIYLGGRYVKVSRDLSQSPWLLYGYRKIKSSVQDTILEPLAKLYQIPPEEAKHRLKFMAAGREDVDVRCLHDGRPFAVEISDPRRQLTPAELARACELITASESVRVRQLVPVTREDLSLLKKGEETKSKTYEALCIKLAHGAQDQVNDATPVRVTPEDIDRLNAYRNTPPGASEGEGVVVMTQRTPLRVLHRRPLLTRTRRILELNAKPVEGYPQLFVLRLRTEAGTYVKEWAHGDLRRTVPTLGDALGAPADLLALDVLGVHLAWPPDPAH